MKAKLLRSEEELEKSTGLASSRTNSMQHLFAEISTDPKILGDISVYEAQFLLTEQEKDYLLQLDSKLGIMIGEMLEQHLTSLQLEVLKLYVSGLTQQEIANMKGRNQSSINKCLVGNISYLPGKKKSYGGIKNKCTKLIKNTHTLKPIMNEIETLCHESMSLYNFSTIRRSFDSPKEYYEWLKSNIDE